MQSDGKILVAGDVRLDNDAVLVARYNADGSLDPTFGESGIVTTAVRDWSSTGHAAALQSDGKIVVAGTTGLGELGGSDVLVLRYGVDGRPDPTFGDGGVVVTDHANGDRARSVVVQSDGKIAIAGGTFAGPGDQSPLVLLARYDVDGVLDPSFGEGGIVTEDLHSFPHFEHHEGLLGVEATSLAVQSAGQLVTAGRWFDEGHLFVLRFDRDGVLDTSFGRDGAAFTDVGGERAYALALQPDEKPVVAGTSCSGQAFLCAGTEPDQVLVARFGTAVGVVPEFDVPFSTVDGFTVRVANYDPAFTWSVVTDAGAATIDANGLVTVSGLAPAASATVTVSTSRPGFESSAASVVGSSLPSILPPTGTGMLAMFAAGALLLGTLLLIVSIRRRTW